MRFQTLRRSYKIFRIFLRLGFRILGPTRKARKLPAGEKARLLRQALEELGSVFVKFGQFLSMRPDFLPLEYCDELFYLLEDVPQFPYPEMEKTFRKEFGKNPQKVFRSFEKEPFASASFGQVYRATLPNGEKVAVKVQRPRIRELVTKDLRIIKIGAHILNFLPFIIIKPLKIVREFERWIEDELDYRQEVKYAEMFYQQYRGSTDIIRTPQIFRKFCRPRILTAEFIEGISLNRIFSAYRTNDTDTIRQVEKIGFSRKIAAEMVIRNFSYQFFSQGIFHADPHPANIIFTPERQLACIDFGIVGFLSKRRRLQCLRYTRFVLHGDYKNATDTLFDQIDTSHVPNLDILRQEHYAGILKYYRLFQEKDRKEGHRHFLGKFLFEGLTLMEKHHAIIPLEVFKFFRAISMVESLIFFSNPDAKISYIAKKFRNFSIAHALAEFPEMLNARMIQDTIFKMLNVVEEEMLKRY